jgi:hypothetical protein
MEEDTMGDRMRPFIGQDYDKHGLRGLRILIMGESSYSGKHVDDITDYNDALAADAIGYDEGRGYWNKSPFYTRIARIFGYEAASFEARKSFWNSVAYYNFLQTVLSQPRQLPAAELWEEAKGPFLDTVRELEPDYVVGFSKRMWWHLPKESEGKIENDQGVFAMSALCPGTGTRLLGFMHPTGRGFRWGDVKTVLEKAIAQ